ncbi:hypothetical protein NONI108955_25585 [Nocardia ninae]
MRERSKRITTQRSERITSACASRMTATSVIEVPMRKRGDRIFGTATLVRPEPSRSEVQA